MFCGAGGVGKTSVAAAAALGAASQLGGKVLVLTIDPAKRLADGLGSRRPRQPSDQVPPELLKAAGVEPRGELWAAMLDTKQSWDDLVLRHAKDEETAYRILDNRLYHSLTGRFVQSHDYIAMERLYEIHAGRRVRPHRHRHSAHAERDRLPRSPGPHGRVLRRPLAAMAHPSVSRRWQAWQPSVVSREPALLPDGRSRPRERNSSKTSPSSS